MFFQKKKPKLDSKVRFQHKGFNQKLQQARQFKRAAKPISENKVQKFFESIGLGSHWLQALVLLVIFAIIYVVYIPNFLTLQGVEIEGLPVSDKEQAINEVNSALKQAKFYNPQHNILFTSEARIREALEKISRIDSIQKIKKDFGSKTIKITVLPKFDRFSVRSSEKVYDLFNDGSLKGQSGVDTEAWENLGNSRIVKIEIPSKVSNDSNAEFLTLDTAKYIIELQDQIKGIVGSSLISVKFDFQKNKPKVIPGETEDASLLDASANAKEASSNTDTSIDSGNSSSQTDSQSTEPTTENNSESLDPNISPNIETPEISLPISAEELTLVMQKGGDKSRTYNVIIDGKESANDVVQRLNLLLSQTTPERFNNLSYVDLRIKDRAFVCLLGAACNR